MANLVGETILHYRIIDKVGEGGMGVVYKAEDTKLERTVALKFLSLTSIGDEEKKRFKREAKAAASLNHPNIATVHAIDEADDQTFIAMEFIEGRSLHEIVGDGHARPLPIDKAIDYATQTAAGLQAAHEKGITHRDIKSANIMVTDKGVVKIMDFGLAKLANRSKLTQLGTTLGTAAYMSPEQSRGENTDHRSDIWSLGVVLYEMISGQMPFKGDYEQAVIYSIQNEEPEPLTALRSGVPIALDGIIAKALAKDPGIRYQNVEEIPADLKGLDTAFLSKSRITTRQTKVATHSRSAWQIKTILPWVIATAALSIALLAWLTREQSEPPLPLMSSLVFEQGTGPGLVQGGNIALSPDGTQLAYVTSPQFDEERIWIRDLSDGSTRPLTGTEGAEHPFWSPDGLMIGYFSEPGLRVVPAKGGPSITLTPTSRGHGGTWNEDGTILFSNGPLFQIPAAGGTPAEVPQLPQPTRQRNKPVFLPDGRHFLFWSHEFEDDNQYIYRGDLVTGQIELLRDGIHPTYVEPGFLVFHIGYFPSPVFAQRFDPDRGVLSGQAFPVLSGINTAGAGEAQLSVTSRTIIFAPPEQAQQRLPLLISRNGDLLDSLAHREDTWVQRFSHDGRRVAFAGTELWVHDLARNISERIPTEVPWPFRFAWSPDDSSIVYSAFGKKGQLRVVSVTGTTKEETVFESDGENIASPEWSPDGRTILFTTLPDETRSHRELWALDLEQGTASPVIVGSFNVFEAKFAPNGQWYAYTSDEGRANSDIYLRPFSESGAPIRVSAEGGSHPRWRKDGRELFYLNGDGHLAVVQVRWGRRPSVSREEILTADPIKSERISAVIAYFDIHPDGQRFILRWRGDTQSVSQLTILRDWVGMLEERE